MYVPEKVKVEWREEVKKEGGEVVQAVEDEAVLPHGEMMFIEKSS